MNCSNLYSKSVAKQAEDSALLLKTRSTYPSKQDSRNGAQWRQCSLFRRMPRWNLSLNNGVRGKCIKLILFQGWPCILLVGRQPASQDLGRKGAIRPPLGDTPSSPGGMICGFICEKGDSGRRLYTFLIHQPKPLLIILATNPIFFL